MLMFGENNTICRNQNTNKNNKTKINKQTKTHKTYHTDPTSATCIESLDESHDVNLTKIPNPKRGLGEVEQLSYRNYTMLL